MPTEQFVLPPVPPNGFRSEAEFQQFFIKWTVQMASIVNRINQQLRLSQGVQGFVIPALVAQVVGHFRTRPCFNGHTQASSDGIGALASSMPRSERMTNA